MKRVAEVIVVFEDGSRETVSRTSSGGRSKQKPTRKKSRTAARKSSKSKTSKSKPAAKAKDKKSESEDKQDLPAIELVWDKAKTPQGRPAHLAPFGRHIWYIAKIGSEVRTFLKDVDDDKAPPATCDTETSVTRAKKCAVAISQKRHRSDGGFQKWVDKHTPKWTEKVGRTLTTVSGRYELDQTRREGQAAVLVYTGKTGRVEVRLFDPTPYTGKNDNRRKPKYSIWAVEYAADGDMVGWFQAYQVLTVELATMAMGVPPFRPLEWEFDGNVARAAWGKVTLVVIDGPELANLHVEDGNRSISLRCGNKTMLRRDAVAIYHEYLLDQSAKAPAKSETKAALKERTKWATDLAKRFRVRSDLALVNHDELAEAVDLLDDAGNDDHAKFLRAARKELESRGQAKLLEDFDTTSAKQPAKSEQRKKSAAKKADDKADDTGAKPGPKKSDKKKSDPKPAEKRADAKKPADKPADAKKPADKPADAKKPADKPATSKKVDKADDAKKPASVKDPQAKADEKKTDTKSDDTKRSDAKKAKSDTKKANTKTDDEKQPDAKSDAKKVDTKADDTKQPDAKSDAKKADTKADDEKKPDAKSDTTKADDTKQPDAKSAGKKADTKSDESKTADSPAKTSDSKTDPPKPAKPAKKKVANKPKRDPAPKRPAPVLDDEDDSIPIVTDDFRNKIQKAARSAADELGLR